jgi:hypothetical protein
MFAVSVAKMPGQHMCQAARGGAMQILLKTAKGKTIVMGIERWFRIEVVKAFIEMKTGVPAVNLRLLFGSRQLEVGNSLEEYGIEANSSITMLIRLKGGASLRPRCW